MDMFLLKYQTVMFDLGKFSSSLQYIKKQNDKLFCVTE